MKINPLKYIGDRIRFQTMVKSIPLRDWWSRVMHKRFHIGWVFLVLGIGLAICIILLAKIV